MPPRFVITGASGFVGAQLIPRLKNAGCDLLLVGRNPLRLSQLFPGVPNCSYKEMSDVAINYDSLLHLAVLNSNMSARTEDFFEVNVGFMSQILLSAKAANIQTFVNFTTFHAVDGSKSPYAESKRVALKILEDAGDITVVNVFMPAVYGDDFSGKLSFLRKVPMPIRSSVLVLLAALLPTLHIDRLASFIAGDLHKEARDVMLANPQEKNPVYRLGKRAIDVVFSIAVIGLFGWLLAVVWVLVRLSSSGPGVFAQQRIGQNGKPFTCYKFRTMKTGTKQVGTHEVTSDTLTKIGAFLRKTKVDELPQAWNVLRAELSLVGPRPCLPMQKELIMAREQRGVFSVRPGITGLAQIKGLDMSEPFRLAHMDSRYIAQRGLLLEIKIIIATVFGKGQGDKVGR